MQRVNYDQIAHLYDEPSRDHAVDPRLSEYLERHAELARAEIRVLDIGCGTGKQLHADRQRFPELQLAGLDLFAGMLREAKKRDRSVTWIQGDGTCLPLRAESMHYVSNQFSYPHIQDKDMFLREAYRVLRPGGEFVVLNLDPWSMPGWILYRYFPEAESLDRRDFLPVSELEQRLKDIGFEQVRSQRTSRQTQEDLRAFRAYARQRYRTSQLIAIAEDAYRAGLERLERDLLEKEETEMLVDSQLCLVTIQGTKPSAED